MRLKHVVLTNNNVNDLVTLMDNKEQILGVNEFNRMLKYNIPLWRSALLKRPSVGQPLDSFQAFYGN
jgi:hypothetical protein